MNLSEEEMVKYVKSQEYGTRHPDRRAEAEICRLRFAVWNSAMHMRGEPWDCHAYRKKMVGVRDEEVLEMIARARLEEEI